MDLFLNILEKKKDVLTILAMGTQRYVYCGVAAESFHMLLKIVYVIIVSGSILQETQIFEERVI